MSSPTSEQEESHESTNSSLLITDTIEIETNRNIDSILEKQLLMEKTKCAQLTNDNQRLLSQNISLCQAIKQQNINTNNLKKQNENLKQQLSKVISTVTALNKVNKQKNATQNMKLKETLIQKDDQIKELNDKYQSIINEKQSIINEKEGKIQHLFTENNNNKNEIARQNEEILELKQKILSITTLYNECVENENENYNRICSERDFWKLEANKLEKECQLNMNEMHQLKMALNNTMNKDYNEENFNILKKKCHLLHWKIFIQYLMYQQSMQQLNETLLFLKNKCLKLNNNNNNNNDNNIECKKKLKESFKVSIFKSLKDIEEVDIDKLLLCQDSKELTDFIISSKMSSETQIKVAVQLLPIVEQYRMDLQNEINNTINRIVEKKNIYNI